MFNVDLPYIPFLLINSMAIINLFYKFYWANAQIIGNDVSISINLLNSGWLYASEIDKNFNYLNTCEIIPLFISYLTH